MNFRKIKNFFLVFHSVFRWSRRCGLIQPPPRSQATSRSPAPLGLKQHIQMKLFIFPSIMTKTKNIMYIVQCIKWKDQYIGQTKKTLEDRFKQHLSYVANNMQATGQHFNQPSHNSSHMTISVLEKVHQITDWQSS